RLRRCTYLAIDRRRRRGDNPPRPVQILVTELAANNLDTGALDLLMNVRRHDRDASASREERFDLARGDRAATHHDDVAGREIEEGRELLAHTDAGTFNRDPTTRSKSASDRPIWIGVATRSRTTSAVL